MTSQASRRETRAPVHGPGALLAVIVVPVVFAITLSTFAWPAARLEPRDLPLGFAGSGRATRAVEQYLERRGDAFDLHRYAGEQAARDAIADREVYGAVVASPDALALLTSSAASPLVAGLLQEAFASLQESDAGTGRTSARTQTVDDVVAADSDDPRGSVLSSLVLPLVLSGVIAAAIVTLRGRSALGQAGALLAAAVLAGLVGVTMVQSWLGGIGGPWLVNAGVLSLTMLAIATLLTGLARLFGRVGLALGAITMVLVGNPWSGISSAPELLPEPTGLIGQLLPPGAGGNLLRSTAFFDGAGGGGELAVLLAWVGLGLTAMWAGARLHRRRAVSTPPVLQPALPDRRQESK